jgi:hypothetical protein
LPPSILASFPPFSSSSFWLHLMNIIAFHWHIWSLLDCWVHQQKQLSSVEDSSLQNKVGIGAKLLG